MSTPFFKLPRRTRALVATAIAAASALSCGTSIQAVYEGDVRFEHCMAMDSRSDVRPTIRRTCWEEWQSFYTFGQTRDRTEYASFRVKQLSVMNDFDEAESSAAKRTSSVVPDPTTALAPPPMMMSTPTDGGVQAIVDGGGDAATNDAPAPTNACEGACEETRRVCVQQCKTPICEKGCASGYKRCNKRCSK